MVYSGECCQSAITGYIVRYILPMFVVKNNELGFLYTVHCFFPTFKKFHLVETFVMWCSKFQSFL